MEAGDPATQKAFKRPADTGPSKPARAEKRHGNLTVHRAAIKPPCADLPPKTSFRNCRDRPVRTADNGRDLPIDRLQYALR